MKTKFRVVKICQDAGCTMFIASSLEKDAILRSVLGDDVGTVFTADSAIAKKKRWLKAFNPGGKIIVDEGVRKAILAHRSLLSVGVKFVSGLLEAGKPVDIACDGVVIARGVPDYGSKDINSIRGMCSDECSRREDVLQGHRAQREHSGHAVNRIWIRGILPCTSAGTLCRSLS